MAEGHDVLYSHHGAPCGWEEGGEIPELQSVQGDWQQGFTLLLTCTLLLVPWYVIFVFVSGQVPVSSACLVQQPHEEGPARAPGAPPWLCWGQKTPLPVA